MVKRPASAYAVNIRRLRARGWTWERIGQRYGVSRQRAHQIAHERKP